MMLDFGKGSRPDTIGIRKITEIKPTQRSEALSGIEPVFARFAGVPLNHQRYRAGAPIGCF